MTSSSKSNPEEQQREALAARLREAREYVGLSQEEVASVLKLSRPAITNIELGTRKVEAIELDQLARLYGRTVEFLLTGDEGAKQSSEQIAFLARATNGLTGKDLEELGRFADFLRNSSKPSKKGR